MMINASPFYSFLLLTFLQRAKKKPPVFKLFQKFVWNSSTGNAISCLLLCFQHVLNYFLPYLELPPSALLCPADSFSSSFICGRANEAFGHRIGPIIDDQ